MKPYASTNGLGLLTIGLIWGDQGELALHLWVKPKWRGYGGYGLKRGAYDGVPLWDIDLHLVLLAWSKSRE